MWCTGHSSAVPGRVPGPGPVPVHVPVPEPGQEDRLCRDYFAHGSPQSMSAASGVQSYIA